MKYLIKNLLILALLATYAFPVSAGINFEPKSRSAESEQKTMAHVSCDIIKKGNATKTVAKSIVIFVVPVAHCCPKK